MTISHDDFITYCKTIHKNKYDYSKTVYTGIKNYISVTCNLHGDFSLVADRHKRGDGCPMCSKQQRALSKTNDTEIFVTKSKLIHNNFYDYSKTIYKKAKEKLIITCPLHGDFSQQACNHLSGQGCPKCGTSSISSKKLKNIDWFIENSKNIHGNNYSYEQTEYRNNKTKLTIICKLHGPFMQTPSSHINQQHGCPICGILKCSDHNRKLHDQFVCDAINVHGNKYSYELSNYQGNKTKVEILCEIHGSFFQRPKNHTTLKQGCPKCVSSWYSKMENDWLTFIGVPEDRLYRNVYVKLNDGRHIRADGFYNNTVYEFWGDMWHGNPLVYPSGVNPVTGEKFEILYQKTMDKIKRIKDSGYKLIDIWEKDWIDSLRSNL